jgi:hypothetical protein
MMTQSDALGTKFRVGESISTLYASETTKLAARDNTRAVLLQKPVRQV